ncbi:VOC family protein [uncultured Sphingomonas sp.]|uniref:VOC family protein n=1 Tax=uncultured Sphingomonas sp. TaxID=158754 RepID=UPI002630355F|nr:VOC family protein [uncultured Sphingomonas sp.]
MSFDIHGRIKCGTVSTPDLDAALGDYRDLLGLRLVEQGTLPADLAASWAAPNAAGQRYALLQPRSGAAGFIRLVEAPSHPDFAPTRTFGWAAFEITVKDVYALAERVKGSGFETIGPPKEIPGMPQFVPMQALGRGREMLYFNQVLSDMPTSDLPRAGSDVDHIFITILATPDRAATMAALEAQFGFDEGGTYTIPYTMINKAFSLPDGHQTTISMVQAKRMPIVEVDDYPAIATPRARHAGMLPPGNAMVTLAIDDLDAPGIDFITPPARRAGPLYADRRTATHIGTAGELIELIEIG